MDHFTYKNNELHAENVAISKIAAIVKTPFYCYSHATLSHHYQVFMENFKERGLDVNLCFAVKANSNLAVINLLANLGAGADAVSEGEIRRCLEAGVKAEKIVFSGVGKTREELKFALENNIMQLNVESEPELYALNEVAASLGKKAPIAFRVNPSVDAKVHDKIATGRSHDKFGIEWERARSLFNEANKLKNIKVQAVAVHIGSQLTSVEPFRQAFLKVRDLVLALRSDGIDISHLDLGGGVGIPYRDHETITLSQYSSMVQETVGDLGAKLTFEPGRVICGNAGILVSEIIYVKSTSQRNFLIVDAAMNDLVRPTLYDAYHEIVAVQQQDKVNNQLYDIVGPVCETGDIFAKQRSLPESKAGDLLALRSAGAYGAVMASEYNSRLLIPEIMVKDDVFKVVRPRNSYESMLKHEIIPTW